ncbi:class I SAM-dependent methyltransferase [Nocardia vinacea]|uniref:class I SAM-dependent methyltransferase n=1 Tax=Nocardia vinacea TaxID=96468 RepID=UPI0002EEA20D|nr:class I SAM-dependent methyltransferase [Nocardia vinacea]
MKAETAYHGELGEQFATLSTDNAYNAYTDRPAMLELAGDVSGLQVLDLGCGAGHFAAELLGVGAAKVVGVDGSESLLNAARQRLGDGGNLHHHDLEERLAFLDDKSFDLVVMALVYHHIDAREQLLAEIRRVLRSGGRLLVSTTHPTADWVYFGGSYFADDPVQLPLGDGFIRFRRMPLQTFLGELLSAGFVLEELVEPRATEQARVVDPRRYDKTHQIPTFLTVKLRCP